MEFTPKRRLLAAIEGRQVDRVPFSPFLAYYFDFLPEAIRQKGELPYLEEMGADPLFRGGPQAYRAWNKRTVISDTVSGRQRTVVRSLDGGSLISEYTYSKEANSWFLTRHPVSTAEDLKLLIQIMEDVEVSPEIETADENIRALGERGLHLAILGTDGKSAFQSLLESWIGTVNLVYLCEDCPDLIDEALRAMRAANIKTVEYTAMSEAAACLSFEDSSTTNVSPALYRKYIMPEISEWSGMLRQAGKPYVQHACGHVRDLLPSFAEQGIASVESVSPPPTGNVTIAEADRILPKSISLIGGIEPTQFLNDPIEKLIPYVESLVEATKGRGFVLANSDSCPPGVEYEKFVRIAELVKSYKQ